MLVPSSNSTSPTAISPLSLHDALPISSVLSRTRTYRAWPTRLAGFRRCRTKPAHARPEHELRSPCIRGWCRGRRRARSEEHTSELQSRFDLVCRLLLEKKNTTPRPLAL